MYIKEFNIVLDIKKKSEQEPFEVVQGDTLSNLLNISLVDGLDPYDLTGTNIEIIFSKSDGKTVQQTDIVMINELDGRLQCTLKTNTTASPGKVIAEVRILSDEILLTSARFEFYVRKSLINDETIESTNEFPILTQLITETNGLIDQVNQIEKQVPENVVQNIDNLEQSKINKADIIHTDTISDPTKVPSSVVTEALGKEIDVINNNLAWVDGVVAALQNDWSGTLLISKNGLGQVWIRGSLIVGITATATSIVTLGVPYASPYNDTIIPVYNFTTKKMVSICVSSGAAELRVGDISGLTTGDTIRINHLYKAI